MTAFSLAEIGGGTETLVPVAHRLEAYAAATAIDAPGSLMPRIMSAVAREPAPTPPVMFMRALRTGSVAAVMSQLIATARAAFGIGRAFPVAVRAQAIALLLTIALVLAGGGAAFAAGAATVIRALQADPAQRPAAVKPSPARGPSAPDRANDAKDKGAKPNAKKPPKAAPPGPRNGGKDNDRDRGNGREGEDKGASSGSARDDDGQGVDASGGSRPRDDGARNERGAGGASRNSGKNSDG